MLNLCFIGRLEREKGVHVLIEMLTTIANDSELATFFVHHVSLDCFGSGSYLHALQKLQVSHSFLKVHGYQPNHIIQKTLQNAHFMLMPSWFLETFGLSALESCIAGVPVIGPKKGGMAPFVLPEYALTDTPTAQELIEKIKEIVHKFSQTLWKNQSAEVKAISLNYTSEAWLERFYELSKLQTGQKVLLVSDYSTMLGGIETYCKSVQELLNTQDTPTELEGYIVPRGKKGKIVRMLGMFAALFNILGTRRLFTKLQQYKPNLIRFQSVLRLRGWLPFIVVKLNPTKRRMMYHDLGYFHPFPTTVTSEDQIPHSLKFSEFFRTVKTRNPLKLLGISLKYVLILLLRGQLQHKVELHFVPSQFMVDHLHRLYKIPLNKIVVLPHFTTSKQ